jgi:pimeloyl-ACP methyl ester carboxylesterase
VNQAEWFSEGERVRVGLRSGTFEIFCRVRGSGPWLTLLHGFPTSSWDWAKIAAGLESRFRLLCFDFLGFGDSDKPRDHPYSILEQSDLTEAVWRHFEVEETGVVAHNYGATVALELMARHSEQALSTRVSRLILLNSALYAHLGRPLLIQRVLSKPILGPLVARAMTERAFVRSFSSVFSIRHPITNSEVRQHWQVLTRRGSTVPVSPRLVRYIAERKLHAKRWEGTLESRDVPKTFLWGMADPRSGAHMADYMRERMPTASLKPLPGVGHYPQLEVPDLVAGEISAAFRGDE